MPDALIRFYNGNYFNTIKASSSLASNPVFTLPINDGNNGEFFKTDGNGVTSWAAIDTPVSASTSTAVRKTPAAPPKLPASSGPPPASAPPPASPLVPAVAMIRLPY